MPKLVDRNPESAPGDRYIDTHCIDCAASREIAPGLVIRPHGKSVSAARTQWQNGDSGRPARGRTDPKQRDGKLTITEILPVRFSTLKEGESSGSGDS